MIKRTERITVRVSPDEEEWIIKKAKENGVSKSRYLREVTLCEKPQSKVPFSETYQPVKLKDAITKQRLEKVLNQQLPKIGNNINQLTRHVNEQRNIGPKQTEELQQLRTEMTRITKAIRKALL